LAALLVAPASFLSALLAALTLPALLIVAAAGSLLTTLLTATLILLSLVCHFFPSLLCVH
jgi:hypothetical protein